MTHEGMSLKEIAALKQLYQNNLEQLERFCLKQCFHLLKVRILFIVRFIFVTIAQSN